jgi:hypothetical protein
LTTGLFAARSSRASDDDDEFIVPDDSEDDAASRSSRVSKRSSRISLLSDDDDEEENARTQKPKKSLGTAARPSLKKAHATSGSGNASTNNFLTAAEQRAQATKDEKKSQEDPFSFLVDVRDVWISRRFVPKARSDAHLRFRRKTVSDLGNLVMTLGHCSSLRKLGMTSALSRNRCSNVLIQTWNMINFLF